MKNFLTYSQFCLERQLCNPFWTDLLAYDILNNAYENFSFRYPGAGRTDCEKVCIVDLHPRFNKYFLPRIAKLDTCTSLRAFSNRRADHEDSFVDVRGESVSPLPIRSVSVVLYSHEALLENSGIASSDYPWEIVAINPKHYDNEPMDPVTMARNYLEKTGGTFALYSEKQLAESIYFWSQHVRLSS